MSLGEKIKELMEVRPVSKDDPDALAMLRANIERNALDEEVLKYPACELWTARTNGTRHAAMPVQKVYVLESVGLNKDSSIQEQGTALLELVKVACFEAYRDGAREVMFLVSDPATEQGAKLLGFEEVTCKVMRRRLK